MQKENSSALTVGSVYKLFRSALRGDAQDYTTGSIRRAVFMLAIPMILEIARESVSRREAGEYYLEDLEQTLLEEAGLSSIEAAA